MAADTRFEMGQRVQSADRPERKGTVIDIDTHAPADRIPTLYVVDFGDHGIYQREEQKLLPYRSAASEANELLDHLGAVIVALTNQRKEPMRTTSSVTDTEFPFAADNVAFILVIPGGDDTKDARGFEHASHPGKKVELVEQAQALTSAGVDLSLLAVWPGASRSDVFLVDDLDAAAEALA